MASWVLLVVVILVLMGGAVLWRTFAQHIVFVGGVWLLALWLWLFVLIQAQEPDPFLWFVIAIGVGFITHRWWALFFALAAPAGWYVVDVLWLKNPSFEVEPFLNISVLLLALGVLGIYFGWGLWYGLSSVIMRVDRHGQNHNG